MKIWVVGRNYPDKTNNRQGSFELEQAKMLAKRGNDVTYIACVLHPFWRVKNGGFAEFEDGPVMVCAYSGFFTPHMSDPLIQFPYFPKIRNRKWEALLKRVEAGGLPDIIHIHFPLMVLSAEVFRRYQERGVKIVVTEHWTKVLNQKIDRYETAQMMSYLQFADAYLAVGYSLRRAILALSGTDREIRVVPNIINDVFQLSDEENKGFRFGLVGRLAPEKQMDRVLETFAGLFRGQTDFRLVVVGGGSEREKLQKLTRSLGIEGQVDFKGSLDRESVASIVKTLDCLVCFSSYETFGVPVIEAWACGVPVITTTAECITDEWDDRLGISVSHTDVDALRSAMSRMAESKGMYDRVFISRFALSRYSEESVFDTLMEIYGEKRDRL